MHLESGVPLLRSHDLLINRVCAAMDKLIAALLDKSVPDIAVTMRARAAVYVDGFFMAPHDLKHNIFVILSRRDDNTLIAF